MRYCVIGLAATGVRRRIGSFDDELSAREYAEDLQMWADDMIWNAFEVVDNDTGELLAVYDI